MGETKTVVSVVLNTESGGTIRVQIPEVDINTEQEVFESTVASIAAAAQATVTGGGTLIQDTAGNSVTGLHSAYITRTIKSWIIAPTNTTAFPAE